MDKKGSPSYDELVRNLAEQTTIATKARLECERIKNNIHSLTKENEKLRQTARQNEKTKNETISISEKEKSDYERKLMEIERELVKEKVTKRYVVQLEMDEKTAGEAAQAEINKDMDTWQRVLLKHIEKVKMEARERAVQDILNNRPDVKAGNGDVDRNASSIQMAQRYISSQALNMDILNQY